jgi:thiol-disulfide isomerase/thioredoxin
MMRSLRAVILVLVVGLASGTALAAQSTDFDRLQFYAAQQAGRPILVDIRASWCPVCAAQEPVIERLGALPEYKDLLIFRVDFDRQKDVVRTFSANSQSTLIAFHGTRETGRSVGDTDPASIATLFRSTAG